jgi:HK97 family phage major capsid protein
MTAFSPEGFEIKAETGARPLAGDGQAQFAELMHAFETFKQTNDERLERLERRGAVDPLIEDKLERLNRALDGAKATLDRQAVDRARPQLEIGRPAEADEYKHAFAAYVKRGEEKGLNSGTNADGGFVVPAEVETSITRRMTAISPIRSIATVRQISTGTYRKPVTLTGPQVGWAGETASRPTTDSPTIDALAFPAAELYAMPAAATAFLDDAAVDIGEWLADEVNAAFAAQETTAFVSGDGTNKPRGFLDYTQSAEASWEWGEIGYVATGEAGAWPDADESDVLIDVVYTLKAGYRQNANWVMNRRTQSAIRKFKDVDGNYLWQPATAADGRATLLGFPLVEAEDMPDIGTSTTPIAFGDFRRGYLVVDRQGVNVLRDPYSAKPHVLFYTTKRVGGGVQDFDAIKLLKFAAS